MPISRVDYEMPAPETVEPAVADSSAVDGLAVMQSLIQQAKDLEQWLRTVTAPARELPSAAAPQTAPPEEAAPENAPVPPQPPEVSPPLEKQPAPVSVAPPADKPDADSAPSAAGAESDFKNRIDTVRGRSQNQNQGVADWQALLDQAVTLLENVAANPALTDYASLKDRLDNVEQIVNSSGNVR